MIRKVMEAIYPCVGGLDVHEKTVVACRRRLVADGLAELEVETFATTRTALQALATWLGEWGVTHVALESTGIYWVPVWNVLEGQFQLLLANAQQLKKVPGRKSDVSDAEWIAQCQQCGLLKASFVPSAEIREWRQLTRQRTKLVDQRTALINRLHAVLQQGNYKLGQVASNIVGVSGRAILQALSEGEHDPAKLAALGQGRLHASLAALVAALDGELSANQQWLVGRLLQQIASVEREIERYSARLRTQMRAYEAQLERLDTISGVGRRVAENLLAEIGPEMTPFPTDDQLVSWAALCPGKEQSGNKRGKTRTAKGNRWLKRVLTEAAWAATHERDGYLAALYRRIAPRRGKKHPDHRGGAHDLTGGLAPSERRCGISGIGRGLLRAVAVGSDGAAVSAAVGTLGLHGRSASQSSGELSLPVPAPKEFGEERLPSWQSQVMFVLFGPQASQDF